MSNKNASDHEVQSDDPGNQLRMAKENWKLAQFKKAHELTLKVLKSDKASQNEVELSRVWQARLHLLNGNKKRLLMN